MLLTLAYMIMRFLLEVVVVVVRRDLSKDAELLVLRQEKVVLRRQVKRARYEPADRMHVLIGDVGVNLHENGMQAEIGFTLAPAYQGPA